MFVLGHVKALHGPVAPPRCHDRHLALKGNESFKNCGLRAELPPHCLVIAAIPDDGLALAVVAEAARLEDGGSPEFSQGLAKVVRRIHTAEGRDSDTKRAHKFFLDRAILRGRQHLRVWKHRLAGWWGSGGLGP